MSWLRHVWVQFALVLVLGAILTLWSQDVPGRQFFGHLGMALMIAAIVTGFYQLHEVSHLFRHIARSTLVKNDYLELLDLRAIRQLRTNAATELLRRGSDNPRYARVELEQAVDSLLYAKLLPERGTTHGSYRAGYTERVYLEFISPETARRALGLESLPIEEASFVTREISILSYTVVAPRLHDEHFRRYVVPVSATLADAPGIPLEKRARCWVGSEESDAKEIKLQFVDPMEAGFSYSGEGEVPFVHGEAKVWLKLEEWRIGFRQPELLSLMNVPTRGIDVHIQVVGGDMAIGFQGAVIGLEEGPRPGYGPNSAWLSHPGWLLADQGYFFWWWKRAAGERKEHLPSTRSEILAAHELVASDGAVGPNPSPEHREPNSPERG